MKPASPAERSLLRRVAVEATGWVLCGLGFALLFLPGPGLPLLVAGLALLGRERPSAARLLQRIHERGSRLREHLRWGRAVTVATASPASPAGAPPVAEAERAQASGEAARR